MSLPDVGVVVGGVGVLGVDDDPARRRATSWRRPVEPDDVTQA